MIFNFLNADIPGNIPGLRLVLLLFAIALSGCSPQVEEPALPQNRLIRVPETRVNTQTGRREITLTVMTYNISSLPWPLKWGRDKALERMGQYLGQLREQGQEPDILLLQEAFSDTGMEKLLTTSGYPNFVRGPRPEDTSPALDSDLAMSLKQLENHWRGEGWNRKFLGSGLYILSNFPILKKTVHAFHYCAGWDCLANKGAVVATLQIPGLPAPIDIFNAHLNARLLAGVPYSHSLIAHQLQIDELVRFMAPLRKTGNPLIFGGDFNVADSPPRIDYILAKNQPYTIVSYYCTVTNSCDVPMTMTGPEPWIHEREMQGFALDSAITVEPFRLEEWFDGPDNGTVLSDHSAYLVHYRLTWSP